jgi:uncharacterized membrane protein
MKFGPVEGSPEEIKNFVENNGLNPADYFTVAESPLHVVWFVIPSVCIMLVAVVLALLPAQKPFATPTFLIGCAASIWLSVNVQLRFRNGWATTILVVGCILILLVALGVVTPLQVFEQIKSLKKSE